MEEHEMEFLRFSGAGLQRIGRAPALAVLGLRKNNSVRKAWFALPILAALTLLPGPSMAGTLLSSGSSLIFTGDATVGAISLSWLCNAPLGPSTCPAGTGDFGVASSTGTFAPYNGGFGFIANISEAAQPIQNMPFTPLPDFITFVLNTNINLTLTELPEGTDTPSANCVGVNHCTPTNAAYVNANNPDGLSAFNLDYDPTTNTTTVGFSFLGIVNDTVPGDNPNMGSYIGSFSEPIVGENPAQVLAVIADGGTITQGYGEDGTLTITATPEPMSLSLMGVGLLGLGFARRRRAKA